MEQHHKVMIVDDNLIDQMITSHIIKTNYDCKEIMVMESALAAIEYLENNKDNPSAIPTLILLDLDMPGMNGIGFLDRFSTFADGLRNACKIVVLTASDVMTDIQQMQADPHVIKLISKPLSKNSLVTMI